ncbi:MAG: ADP/ATP-dependent (S)-NAD(P)H-hydrate dehydratase [Microbacteriaceae bacterium]
MTERPQTDEHDRAPLDLARWIAVPDPSSDKYSRGVVGFVTGSTQYPGAAVLGVEAALRTGAGMVRYAGDERPSDLVLARRPEAVLSPGPELGRVQAWVLGSGQDAEHRDEATSARLESALAAGVPTVLDSGALDVIDRASGPVIITPHAGELARITGLERASIEHDPERAARDAAARFGVTVLLKGHRTVVASPDGAVLAVTAPTTWLATAGSGDALAGILGALVATHHRALSHDGTALLPLGAAAAMLHGRAGARAGAGGPFTILDLCAAIPATIADALGASSPRR